jgi:hypothetical protein
VATSAFRGLCFQFSKTVDLMLRKRGGGLNASGVLIPSGSRSSQVLLFSGLSDQAASADKTSMMSASLAATRASALSGQTLLA